MAGHDGGRHALDGLPVADVADLVLGAELVRHGHQALRAACDEHAVPAAALQPSRQRGADAARAAGDDRDFQQTRTTRRASDSRPAVSETMAVSWCRPFLAPPTRQVAL